MATLVKEITLLKLKIINKMRHCHRLLERADDVYEGGNTEQWEAHNVHAKKCQEDIIRMSATLYNMQEKYYAGGNPTSS